MVSPANGFVVALLRSRFHGVASRGLLVLEWVGRTSGRSDAIPVGYQPSGDGFVVLLSKPGDKTWWKNFRTPWPATLQIRGRRVAVTGVVVAPDEPAFFGICDRTLPRLPRMGSQLGGVKYDRSRGLTDDQRATLAEHAAVVRFDPAG